MVTKYSKFIVAAVGVAVTFGLISGDEGQAIAGAITALAVLIVPNA